MFRNFLFTLFFFGSMSLTAQEGIYIIPWGMGQQVNMYNETVFYNRHLQFRTTYGFASGIDVVYNETKNIGWQSGLSFSRQGQSYKGFIEYDGNTKKEVNVYYTSIFIADYLKMPMMIRFNSNFNKAENFNVSISAGFLFNYLIGGTIETNYLPEGYDLSNFKAQWVHKPLTTSFALHSGMNYFFNNTWAITSGLKLDRSIVNIDRKNKKLSDEAPVEFYPPVSTSKDPTNSEAFYNEYSSTKNVTTGIYVGISYKLNQKINSR
jgi:hypothetical protein